eukprot:Sspe_Gene.48640::Locus_25489_Transcript_1_1_Confidence_1.000_Length_3663::g.48640::m.48640
MNITARNDDVARRYHSRQLQLARKEFQRYQIAAVEELKQRLADAQQQLSTEEKELHASVYDGPRTLERYKVLLEITARIEHIQSQIAELQGAIVDPGEGITEPTGPSAPEAAAQPPAQPTVHPYDTVLAAREAIRRRLEEARPPRTLGLPKGYVATLANASKDFRRVPPEAPRVPTGWLAVEVAAAPKLPEGVKAAWCSELLCAAREPGHVPHEDLETIARQVTATGDGPMFSLEGPTLCGKTVLALQLAQHHAVLSAFPDGVVVVHCEDTDRDHSLAMLPPPAPLAALLSLLGGEGSPLPDTPETLCSLLKGSLRGRSVLCVVDNVSSGALVAALRWVVQGSSSRVLFTSCIPLDVVRLSVSPTWSTHCLVDLLAKRGVSCTPQQALELAKAVQRTPAAVSLAAGLVRAGDMDIEEVAALCDAAIENRNANALLRKRHVLESHAAFAVPLLLQLGILHLSPRAARVASVLSAMHPSCGVPPGPAALASGMHWDSDDFASAVRELAARGFVQVLWSPLDASKVVLAQHHVVRSFLLARGSESAGDIHLALWKGAGDLLEEDDGDAAEYFDRYLIHHLHALGDTAAIAETLLHPRAVQYGRVSAVFAKQSRPARNPATYKDLLRHFAWVSSEVAELASILPSTSPWYPSAALTRVQVCLSPASHSVLLKKLIKAVLIGSKAPAKSSGGVLWAKGEKVSDEVLARAPLELAEKKQVEAELLATTPDKRRCIAWSPGGFVVHDILSMAQVRAVKTGDDEATALLPTHHGTVLIASVDGTVKEWHASKTTATKKIDRFLFTDLVAQCTLSGGEGARVTQMVHVGSKVCTVWDDGFCDVLEAAPSELALLHRIQLTPDHPCLCTVGEEVVVGAPGWHLLRMVDPTDCTEGAGVVVTSFPPGEGVVSVCSIPVSVGWRVAVGLQSGPIAVFDRGSEGRDLTPSVVYRGHTTPACSLAGIPGTLCSISHDTEIRVWGADAEPLAVYRMVEVPAGMAELAVRGGGEAGDPLELLAFTFAHPNATASVFRLYPPPPRPADGAPATRVFGDGLGRVVVIEDKGPTFYDAGTGKEVPSAKVSLLPEWKGAEGGFEADRFVAWHDTVIGKTASASADEKWSDDAVGVPTTEYRARPGRPVRCDWAVEVTGHQVYVWPLGSDRETAAVVVADGLLECACVAVCPNGRVVVAVRMQSKALGFFEVLRYTST